MFWADGMVIRENTMWIKERGDFLNCKGLLRQMIREDDEWDSAYKESKRLFIHELYHVKQIRRLKEEYGHARLYYWKWIQGWGIAGQTKDPIEENAYKAPAVYWNLTPRELKAWFLDDQPLSSMIS